MAPQQILGIVDTGFSGFAMLSLNHLAQMIHGERCSSRKHSSFTPLFPHKASFYRFGRGQAAEARFGVGIRISPITIIADVVDVEDSWCPLLLGQRFIRANGGTISADLTCSFTIHHNSLPSPVCFTIPVQFSFDNFAAHSDSNALQVFTATADSTFLDTKVPKPLRKSLIKRYSRFSKLFNISQEELNKIHHSRHANTVAMMQFLKSMLPPETYLDPEVQEFFRFVRISFEKIIANCVECQRNQKRGTFPLTMNIQSCLQFMDRLGCDFLIMSHARILKVLVVQDYATNFLVLLLFTGKIQTGEIFRNFLNHYAVHFGVPRAVIFDEDGLFKGAAEDFEEQGIFTGFRAGCAHAQAGKIERAVETVRHTLYRSSEFIEQATILDLRMYLSYLANSVNNQITRGSSSAALRALGCSTSLVFDAMSDGANSAFSKCLIREKARSDFHQTVNDVSFRRLLSSKHQNAGQVLEPGTHVYYFRHGEVSKSKPLREAGTILALDQSGNYLIRSLKGAVIAVSPRDVVVKTIPDDSLVYPNRPEPLVHLSGQRQQGGVVAPALTLTKEEPDEPPPLIESDDEDEAENAKIYQKIQKRRTKDLKKALRPKIPKTPEMSKPTENSESSKAQKSTNFRKFVDTGLNDWLKEKASFLAEFASKITDISLPKIPSEFLFDDDFNSLLDFGMVTDEISKYSLSWEDLNPTQKQAAYKKAMLAYDHYGCFEGPEIPTKQVDEWVKNNPGMYLKMTGRWVLSAKFAPEGEVIGKARYVVKGFQDHVSDSSENASPTVSAMSINLSEFLGMSYGFSSYSLDFSDAFFQGKVIEEGQHLVDFIYLELPVETTGGRKVCRRLRKDVPGMAGASRSWYESMCGIFLDFGWRRSSVDASLFVLHNSKGELTGIMPVHVDDARMWSTKEVFDSFHEYLQGKVTLGFFRENVHGQPVDFNGCLYTTYQSEQGLYSVSSQRNYISSKLKKIPLPSIPKSREDEECPHLRATFEQSLGCLVWTVTKTQKQFAFDASFLAGRKNCLTFGDCVHLNSVIDKIQANPIEPKIVAIPKPWKLIGICDGSEVSSKKERPQIGRLIAVAPLVLPGEKSAVSVLGSRSQRCPRVGHSAYDVECIAGVVVVDELILMRDSFNDILQPKLLVRWVRFSYPLRPYLHEDCPVGEVHSDGMSVVRQVRGILSMKGASNRRRADIADLREAISLQEISEIYFILGPQNPVDCLTKRLDNLSNFLQLICQCFYDPPFGN